MKKKDVKFSKWERGFHVGVNRKWVENGLKSASKFFSDTHFFIGKSIYHLSLELLTKFWKMSLKVA